MADPWKVNMHPTHLNPTFKRDFNWLKLLQYVYIENHKHTEVCMLTYFSMSKCYSAIKHLEKAKIFKRGGEARRGGIYNSRLIQLPDFKADQKLQCGFKDTL